MLIFWFCAYNGLYLRNTACFIWNSNYLAKRRVSLFSDCQLKAPMYKGINGGQIWKIHRRTFTDSLPFETTVWSVYEAVWFYDPSFVRYWSHYGCDEASNPQWTTHRMYCASGHYSAALQWNSCLEISCTTAKGSCNLIVQQLHECHVVSLLLPEQYFYKWCKNGVKISSSWK